MSDLTKQPPSGRGDVLIVRADAGTRLGTGHIMRMIALAQAWERRGGSVVFVCVEIPEQLVEKVEASGFGLERVAGVEIGGDADACGVLEAVERHGAGAVVCDGYQFGTAFQRRLRAGGVGRLMMVADYGVDSGFDCDFLLNQNPGISTGDYPGLGAGSQLLSGPSFALLREEFVRAGRNPCGAGGGEGGGRRILLTFGGTDPDNVTGRVIGVLGGLAGDEGWEIRAVIGRANRHRDELGALVATYPNVELVVDPPDMGELMRWCDVAVTAGGSTCWELCYCGVAMVLICVADNQAGIVRELGESGAGIDLGWHEDLDEARLAGELKRLSGDEVARGDLSRRAAKLVDGRGADRVAAALADGLRVTIATAAGGWFGAKLQPFVDRLEAAGHRVSVVTRAEEIEDGDILFLLSFWSLVSADVLGRNVHNLVVHESALPAGKGWSPLTWQILGGENRVPVTLFEAEEGVDSGPVYLRDEIVFGGTELLPELREQQAAATFALCERFVTEYPAICARGQEQAGEESFFPRRGPEDSRLDPDKTLAEQFALLRTVDNDAYPAFFEYAGERFRLRIDRDPGNRAG